MTDRAALGLCLILVFLALIVIITFDFILLDNRLDKIENQLKPLCNSATSSIDAQGKTTIIWYPKGCRHK